MTTEKEAFYELEIAPVLMNLANKCESNGLSFLAMVEWRPGEGGTTARVDQRKVGVGFGAVYGAMRGAFEGRTIWPEKTKP